jgi:hypothetical protein
MRLAVPAKKLPRPALIKSNQLVRESDMKFLIVLASRLCRSAKIIRMSF